MHIWIIGELSIAITIEHACGIERDQVDTTEPLFPITKISYSYCF